MRDHDGALSFTPLPEGLTRLSFGLCFRDRRLKVKVKHHQARYSLLAGPPLQIIHHGQAVTVTPHQAVSCAIPKLAAGEAPSQPFGRRPGTAATRGLNVAVSERGGHER
jgi:alpha,alpha-trehalose phosphorylase